MEVLRKDEFFQNIRRSFNNYGVFILLLYPVLFLRIDIVFYLFSCDIPVDRDFHIVQLSFSA